MQSSYLEVFQSSQSLGKSLQSPLSPPLSLGIPQVSSTLPHTFVMEDLLLESAYSPGEVLFTFNYSISMSL